jgi:hypothetical protein
MWAPHRGSIWWRLQVEEQHCLEEQRRLDLGTPEWRCETTSSGDRQ